MKTFDNKTLSEHVNVKRERYLSEFGESKYFDEKHYRKWCKENKKRKTSQNPMVIEQARIKKEAQKKKMLLRHEQNRQRELEHIEIHNLRYLDIYKIFDKEYYDKFYNDNLGIEDIENRKRYLECRRLSYINRNRLKEPIDEKKYNDWQTKLINGYLSEYGHLPPLM